MNSSHNTNGRKRCYYQHYWIKASFARVEETRRQLPGIEEIDQDVGKCLIRYIGDKEDLKRYFGRDSVQQREIEDDDEEALYMKQVTPSLQSKQGDRQETMQ
ncbi:uncharacterized protein PV06_11826 [Exophiala oligosperma]|uniref:Uncharacterized protein n=1 Tax=Exophiala oligosperma TaxID=215243 RepID=A0A0D2BEB0_9EURO|nr:uncharacterized protein PV06_11826 [Exophiala oligosperma]KIW35842.1 hypothetical protein PV06_11826 [Exophiala oligosperma]